jgi:hypothetical protein
MYLSNVTLSGFTDSECGGMLSRAIVLNPSQIDLAVPIYGSGINWGTSPPASRFDFSFDSSSAGDDAHSFPAAFDNDGTVAGSKGGVVLGNNPTLMPDALTGQPDLCTLYTGWTGYACPAALPLREALLQNMDRDTGFRKLGTLQVTRRIPGVDNSTWKTSNTIGPIDDECAERMYFGYYRHMVVANSSSDLYMPATEPSHIRYNWYSSNPSEGAVVSYFIQRPYAWTMFVDGAEVQMMIVNNTGPQLPAPTDPPGTFLFNPQVWPHG